jgi:hypothetical protein
MADFGEVYNMSTHALQETFTSVRICVDSGAGDAGGLVADGLLGSVCLLAATFTLVGGPAAKEALCATKNKVVLAGGDRKEHHMRAGVRIGGALRYEWRNRFHPQLALIQGLLQFLSALLGVPSSPLASVGASGGTDLESYPLHPLVVVSWTWLQDQILMRLERWKKENLEMPFDELAAAAAELQTMHSSLTREMQQV